VENSNGPGTDGHLATVSYLFGAPAPEDSAPEHSAPVGSRQPPSGTASRSDDVDAGDLAADDPGARGAAAGTPRDLDAPAPGGSNSSSGWYLEPGATDESSFEPDAEPESEPEPASIVAARRFLAAVERPEAAPREPRFAAVDEIAVDPEPRKPPAVRKASINALARKGMSSAEMTSLLESREIEPDEVAAEVARLEAAGLLDDRVLAEDLVRSLRDRKGLGRSAINSELRRRRVDQAAIDEALDSVDVDDELERATEVAVKRAGQLSSYDRPTAERRLSAFLMRRGYSGSVVGAAVAAALGPVGPRFR
jgi:regulatory protein